MEQLQKILYLKGFVYCTPLGSIHLLSIVWGYRASEVQILRESGFISHAYHIVRVTRF